MKLLFANNATSALANSITAASTTLAVQPGHGARFPQPAAGEGFYLTLFQVIAGIESNYEVVLVTARSVDTLTIQRGQDGTAARAYVAGDSISHRPTAGIMSKFAQPDEDVAFAKGASFANAPTAPTAAPGTNSTVLATTAFARTEIANAVSALVASSPAALDTLNELATALGNDANFATTMTTALGNRVRVDTAAQGLSGAQQTNAKTNLALQNVDNTSDMNKPVSSATTTALGLKADKTAISNVNNTSDADKPVSTAQASALALKAPLANPAFTGVLAVTDANAGAIKLNADSVNVNARNFAVGQLDAYGQLDIKVSATRGADAFAGNTLLSLRRDGAVSVGTTSPEAKLHVKGAAAGTLVLEHDYSYGEANWALKLKGTPGTPGGYLSQAPAQGGFQLAQGGNYYGGGNFVTDANSTSFAAISGSGGVLSFSTVAGLAPGGMFSGAEQMRIDTSGNLLVGTTAPRGKVTSSVAGTLPTFAAVGKTQSDIAPDVIISRTSSNQSIGAAPSIQFEDGVGTNSRMIQAGYGNMQFFGTGSGGWAEHMRIDTSGNLLVGTTSGSCHTVYKGIAQGTQIFNAFASSAFYIGSGENFSGAATSQVLTRNTSTNRSLNAAGTINASGADYAEYMRKADTCGVLAKGAIVGVDVNGQLTDKFANAVSFLIKSTDPSLVGGDTWGSADCVGTRPEAPQFVVPVYTGAAHPGEAPVVPTQPAQPELTGEDSDHDLVLAYEEAHEQYELTYQLYAEDAADYARAAADYARDSAAHARLVSAEQFEFDTITMPAYEAALAAFEHRLETARQKVDRIAYCGQVPVNVTGAVPGQYVIPVQAGVGIGGQLVNKADLTMAQYLDAVGVVQNILPDGRANVRVKVI